VPGVLATRRRVNGSAGTRAGRWRRAKSATTGAAVLERAAHPRRDELVAFAQTDGAPALWSAARAGMNVAVQAAPTAVGVEVANGNGQVVQQFVAARWGSRRRRRSCLRSLHRLGCGYKRPQERRLTAAEAKRAAWSRAMRRG